MEEIEKEILKKISREELEQKISRIYSQFEGLITRELSLKLIAKELGVDIKSKIMEIINIEDGMENITVRAKVIRFFPVQILSNGKRVRTIRIRDKSGEINLRFWNDGILKLKEVLSGDFIEFQRVYMKNGDLNFGFRSKLKILKRAPIFSPSDFSDNDFGNVIGFIERKNFRWYITDKKVEKEVIGSKLSSFPSERSRVILENVVQKRGKIYTTSSTRILIRKENEIYIEDLIFDGNSILIKTRNKGELSLSFKDFLSAFSLTPPSDLSPEVVFEMYRNNLIGKTVKIIH